MGIFQETSCLFLLTLKVKLTTKYRIGHSELILVISWIMADHYAEMSIKALHTLWREDEKNPRVTNEEEYNQACTIQKFNTELRKKL